MCDSRYAVQGERSLAIRIADSFRAGNHFRGSGMEIINGSRRLVGRDTRAVLHLLFAKGQTRPRERNEQPPLHGRMKWQLTKWRGFLLGTSNPLIYNTIRVINSVEEKYMEERVARLRNDADKRSPLRDRRAAKSLWSTARN